MKRRLGKVPAAGAKAHATASEPPRAWQRMLSGRRLDLLDPSPHDIEIADIAHGLARVARWNGQTTGTHAFSVAQHSVVVEAIFASEDASPDWRLAALLHDAPEYVIGDLISPFKAALGLDYKAFELRLLGAIHRRFGLPEALPAALTTAIKRADKIAAYHEATRLAGFTILEAERYFTVPSRLPRQLADALRRLEPEPVALAEKAYLARFAVLSAR